MKQDERVHQSMKTGSGSIRHHKTNNQRFSGAVRLGIFCVLIGIFFLTGCGSEGTGNSGETDGQQGTETFAAEQAGKSGKASKEESTSASRDFFAMDTYMSVLANGSGAEEAVDEAIAEVHRLDALLSTGNKDSEVGKINENGGGTLSEDGKYLFAAAMELYEETGGLFDISIYPVMELWGFTDQNYHVPSEEDLANALAFVDASKISLDEQSGELSFAEEGMKIDFGGIAKGYTSARLMEVFRENGIQSALVNLGGNVQALGTKPNGSKWRIAVQDPEDASGMIGVLSIADQAVITSGGYERYFEEDGNTYHHIIDPQTGYPAENGLISVTIVCGDGTKADGLSTSLFIMGKDDAIAFWRAHSDAFDMILMTKDRSLFVSEGIAESFTSENLYEIVKKQG